jgi:L-amino acid N-acyltransferase YncA
MRLDSGLQMDIVVAPMRAEDRNAVQAIYWEGIATDNATFECAVPEWENWDKSHLCEPRLVALLDGNVIGWAALSAVSARGVYAGVAEVSVYVAAGARGRSIGKALLQALVVASELAGIWTLQASIFRENSASIALHRACGFREVGYRERIGRLSGMWRDTILMERRSEVIGIAEGVRQ